MPAPAKDLPWTTIVLNDPVNLMSYVEFVFREYFRYSRAKAHRLMLEVHEQGRSRVSTGSREQMETDVQAMHGYGLWAECRPAEDASGWGGPEGAPDGPGDGADGGGRR
ncbi:ATP-dependent Clp protease adapter ClpS [Brevibacterium album]|uniref:ATP-dependent Clp protease adapter ClpS n=1 Tax=Brevibacterium album TaxID=417948 RepID=UPI0003F4E5A5|nr:ATP-dependent Clp protease adapter ClpS [Brevibacterium album]